MNELKPLLVVIVGPMGAGKTAFYDAHLKEAFPLLVPSFRTNEKQCCASIARSRLRTWS